MSIDVFRALSCASAYSAVTVVASAAVSPASRRGVFNFWHTQKTPDGTLAKFGAHFVVDKDGNVGRGGDPTQIQWHVSNPTPDKTHTAVAPRRSTCPRDVLPAAARSKNHRVPIRHVHCSTAASRTPL